MLVISELAVLEKIRLIILVKISLNLKLLHAQKSFQATKCVLSKIILILHYSLLVTFYSQALNFDVK